MRLKLLRSIRARLTAWHTLTLAALLLAFGLSAWFFLVRSAQHRVDKGLRDLSAAVLVAWQGESEDEGTSAAHAAAAAAEFHDRDQRVLVFDAAGALVAISDSAPLSPELTPARLADSRRGPLSRLLASIAKDAASASGGGYATIRDADEDGVPVRAFARSFMAHGAPRPFTVVTLQSMRAEDDASEAFLRALMLAIPIALVFAAAGGYLLARASLSPVLAMGRQAARISENTLNERLPVTNPHDELGSLASILNGLLERLEDAFRRQQNVVEQQRRFMADASHELRTPITAVGTAADVALARPDRDRDALRETLDVVRGQARSMGRIVNDLLLLARADAGQLPVRREPVYLEEVLHDCARAAGALAATRQVRLVAPPADEAPFAGDPHLLRRLVAILIDNALKFTPAGGTVRLTLERGDAYRIVVEDTGPGVPEPDRERIFERFARSDASRTRTPASGGVIGSAGRVADSGQPEGVDGPVEAARDVASGGAGLGLAIGRWIAEAHSGTLVLEKTGPSGSRFVASLPLPGAGEK